MRNRGLQTLTFISTRFKIGNPGIFYDPDSFRFTSRCSGAPTGKHKIGKPEEGWYDQPKPRCSDQQNREV